MRVAILGVGQTSYEREKGISLDELVFEATKNALEDSGLNLQEIESVVTAGSDGLDGRAISNMTVSGSCGAYRKDEVKVSDGGIYGLVLAYLRVASGLFGNSLVVSWTKSSEVSPDTVGNLSFDPLYLREAGINPITYSAIQVSLYKHITGARDEDAAKVVVKNRGNALKNPLSHLKRKPSVKEIKSSRFVSYPLREIHIPPESDGACALVISSERWLKTRKKTGQKYAWIRGIGWSLEGYYRDEKKELVKLSSLRKAAKTAYKMAGIKNPAKEIDTAEVSDITAYHEIMIYEALGFCGDSEGIELVRKGVTEIDGELPVNPSGGILSSNPIFASSLVRVAEAALQVMGKAGERQVKGVNTALAQGFTWSGTQGSCVVILDNRI